MQDPSPKYQFIRQSLYDAIASGELRHDYFESPGTAHEGQTCHRSLNGFAPLLFL